MALVLSRKPSEDILIGKDIRVGIVSVKDGRTVSVAITAPKGVRIVRAEIAADEEVAVEVAPEGTA